MDDRWRDSYDSWKLATPPEYEISPEEEEQAYREAREEQMLTSLTEAQKRRAVEIVARLAEEWREQGYLDNESRGTDGLRNLLAEIARASAVAPTDDDDIKF
jgi:hypothetical protein